MHFMVLVFVRDSAGLSKLRLTTRTTHFAVARLIAKQTEACRAHLSVHAGLYVFLRYVGSSVTLQRYVKGWSSR